MAPRIRKAAARGKDTSSEKESSKRDRDRVDRQKRDKPAAGKPAAGRTAKGKRRVDKSRTKRRTSKAVQEKVKGWLATPADWARFNAWAEINAKPKKIPEPEAIVHPTKPLSQLKKRMKVLAEPRKVVDPSIHCRLDQSISKAALKAVPSMRTNLLALPIVKLVDYGRVYYQVSPAALKYEASKRIIALSQPCSTFLPEECQPPRMRICQPSLDKERLKTLAMQRKLLHCPEQLTQEEIEELFTPLGTRRTALAYKITPWVEFMALPSYKFLKERRDGQAATWKKMIINDGEKRGKEAFAEYKIRRAKERERERRMRMLRKKLCDAEEEKKRKEEEEAKMKRDEGKGKLCDEGETMSYEDEKDCKDEQKGKDKKGVKRKRETADDGDTKKVARRKEPEEKISKEEEERRRKKRRKRKHAWRFAPYPCKDDPYLITKETLEFEATPRMTELATPRIRKNRVIKANPFTVKKSALSATPSGRTETLAKPSRPRSPVEKRPAREKDAYGRPIFIIPVYGKVLPKTKPYKMGECPKEDEEEKKKKKKKDHKKRPIDPIAYESTYDPCIYPDLARKQKKERKRAAKLSPKKKGKRRKAWAKEASRTTVAGDADKREELDETNVNEEEPERAEDQEGAEE